MPASQWLGITAPAIFVSNRQPEVPGRTLSHDTWIDVLAAALGRVSHIAEPLLRYRQHGGNAIGVTTSGTAPRANTRSGKSIHRLRERMV